MCDYPKHYHVKLPLFIEQATELFSILKTCRNFLVAIKNVYKIALKIQICRKSYQ